MVRVLALLAVLSAPPAEPSAQELLDESAALAGKNEYAKAIEVASRIPESAPPSILVAKHARLAAVLINLGRTPEAKAHVEQARAAAEASGRPADRARAALAEGNLRRLSGWGDHGVAAYKRAETFAVASGDRHLLGDVYRQLAGGYNSVEDWGRGLYYSNRAFELIENPSPAEKFDHAILEGVAAFEQYDRDAAEASYKAALDMALQSGKKRDQSLARGELAYTYWSFDRDNERALALWGEAIAIAVEGKVPTLEATWRLDRGNVFRERGDYARAMDDYQQVIRLEEATRGERMRFPAVKNTGQTWLLMGNAKKAQEILEPLVKTMPWHPSPRHVWQAHMELASTYQQLGMADRAEAEFKAMLAVLEEHRSTSILDSFRTGSFAHALKTFDPYDRYIRFLLADGRGRVAEALQVSEQARARGFLEMLKSVRSELAARLPPSLLEEESHLRGQVSQVQEALREADLPRERREELLTRLAGLEREQEAFRVKLRVEHPSLAEARYPELAATSDLKGLLRPGEAALSFYLSEPESFRFLVTRDRVAVQRLAGRAAIEKQVERVRALIRAPSETASVRREAAALAELLLSGLDLAAESPLVVVPHGALNYLPFEVLPLSGKPLLVRHAVSYAPSLNSLAWLRKTPVNPAKFRILAIGDPALAPAALAASDRSGDVDNVALLGPLPSAGEELAAIQRAFPSATETLRGPQARETALKQQPLNRFAIVHFATHALVSERHPKRSGLLLSPEPGEDGLLQVSEIYGLGLKSDLVVLSACQTALGQEVTGEGIVGLTRAFFYAGSRSVIAALWNLNDRFAAEFIERFYRELKGRSAEEALRRTKIAFADRHPFYWAPLVLTGDGTRVMEF